MKQQFGAFVVLIFRAVGGSNKGEREMNTKFLIASEACGKTRSTVI